jgi:hypothetical protein
MSFVKPGWGLLKKKKKCQILGTETSVEVAWLVVLLKVINLTLIFS